MGTELTALCILGTLHLSDISSSVDTFENLVEKKTPDIHLKTWSRPSTVSAHVTLL